MNVSQPRIAKTPPVKEAKAGKRVFIARRPITAVESNYSLTSGSREKPSSWRGTALPRVSPGSKFSGIQIGIAGRSWDVVQAHTRQRPAADRAAQLDALPFGNGHTS
jgi:hypothetical protein